MARGRAGTQMKGLPRIHVRGPDGKPLCGAKRKWGALIAQTPDAADCKACLRKLEKQRGGAE